MFIDKNFTPVCRGDLFWIEMPAPIGAHPGVVVSNDHLNATSNSVEVVLTSTNLKSKVYPTDADIMASGRLSRASCSQIHTVRRELLGSYIGHCTADEMQDINRALLASLGMEAEEEVQHAEVCEAGCTEIPVGGLHRTEDGLIVEVYNGGVQVYAPCQNFEFVR